MSKDVRKEQVKLLQFEKRLVGLAAFLAAGASTAASASTKINHEAASRAYDDIRVALAHLADVTSQAHAALDASVASEGVAFPRATLRRWSNQYWDLDNVLVLRRAQYCGDCICVASAVATDFFVCARFDV